MLTCTACGHVAQIHTPLLFNDYRIGLKIQYYPAHLLDENLDYVCNDFLEGLSQIKKFTQEYGLFMPGLEKQEGLLVVFSLGEMVHQIRFRTKLFEMRNDAEEG